MCEPLWIVVRCEIAQRGLAATKTTTSEATKHLIIERPVALDLAGLQHLRAVVDANGVKTDRQFRAEMESVLSG
jgi:predicted dehydrogenase